MCEAAEVLRLSRENSEAVNLFKELRKAKGDRQQLELRFDDGQAATSASECSTANGFPHLSAVKPADGWQIFSSCVGSN